MNIVIPEELTDFFHHRQIFLIISHQDPDGDCITSSMVLSSLLEKMGKEAILLSPGPFDRPEIAERASLFNSTLRDSPSTESTGAVVLDCSTLDRIADFAPLTRTYKTAVIDHHAEGKPFGDIRFIEPEAPSVTFLIYHLMDAIGFSPSKEEAELLLLGLCTDTGFFRHIEGGRSDVFDLVACLARTGASPKEVYQEMYGGKDVGTRILLGTVLSRTERHIGGKLLYTCETAEDRRRAGTRYRDSDTLYSLLQNSRGVEAIIYVREEDDGTISAGLRSNTMDVSKIASSFGGGGHPKAAGLTWEGTMSQLKKSLLKAFNTALPN